MLIFKQVTDDANMITIKQEVKEEVSHSDGFRDGSWKSNDEGIIT